MDNRTKAIFVTGGTGLLGSHLIYKLISTGEQVRAIHRKTSNREILEKVISYYKGDKDKLLRLVEWIECDISDYDMLEKTMEGAEVVYHCAAVVSFENRQKDYVLDNNIKGTSNIVKACFANKIRKLCHVSSNAALGAYDGESMVNETHGWDEEGYRSPYGTSKYLSEQEVWKGIREGLNAVIVNPTIILGPGGWNRGSSSFFPKIYSGLLFYTSGTNGYVDVNDVVTAMIILTKSDISGERFIVNAENLNYGRFFTMIAKSLKVRRPLIKVPKALSYLALPMVSVLEILSKGKTTLTKEMLKVAWSRITYDNSKLIKYTGFSFTPIEKTVKAIGEIFLEDMKKIPR
ncbi:MAG TPA: NAD-dependent epimerase/dehydratase family protein [Bacteroidales bacterium]|nr:NAD-dependent epimerase/dehydratase family protein [Bacteroidales bacterium]